jgi:hypothetical protein
MEVIKLINTSKRFDKFVKILVNRVKENKPISDNAVLDGFIISFLVVREKIIKTMWLGKNVGRLFDGTIQQIEQVMLWVSNNEEELIKIYKNK